MQYLIKSIIVLAVIGLYHLVFRLFSIFHLPPAVSLSYIILFLGLCLFAHYKSKIAINWFVVPCALIAYIESAFLLLRLRLDMIYVLIFTIVFLASCVFVQYISKKSLNGLIVTTGLLGCVLFSCAKIPLFLTYIILFFGMFLLVQKIENKDFSKKLTKYLISTAAISGYTFWVMFVVSILILACIKNIHTFNEPAIIFIPLSAFIIMFLSIILSAIAKFLMFSNILYIVNILFLKYKNSETLYANSLIFLVGLILSYIASVLCIDFTAVFTTDDYSVFPLFYFWDLLDKL